MIRFKCPCFWLFKSKRTCELCCSAFHYAVVRYSKSYCGVFSHAVFCDVDYLSARNQPHAVKPLGNDCSLFLRLLSDVSPAPLHMFSLHPCLHGSLSSTGCTESTRNPLPLPRWDSIMRNRTWKSVPDDYYCGTLISFRHGNWLATRNRNIRGQRVAWRIINTCFAKCEATVNFGDFVQEHRKNLFFHSC